MDSDIKVPHVRAGAVISISLTLPNINDLQMLYSWLLNGKGKEYAETIKEKLEKKEPLSGEQAAIVTITQLITKIHKAAIDSGQVDYLSLEDSIKASVPQ